MILKTVSKKKRWNFLFGGLPIQSAHQHDWAASSGHVIVAPEIWKILEMKCQGNQISPKLYRIQALKHAASIPLSAKVEKQEAPQWLQIEQISRLVECYWAHIPTPLRAVVGDLSGYRKDQSIALNEVRVLTVLYIVFPGLEFSWDKTTEIQQMNVGLQKVLDHYNGHLLHFTFTNQLECVIGFGLPFLTHGHSGPPAVLSALELANKLAALKISYQMGLATDRALCTIVGNSARREYLVFGPAIDKAQKLATSINQIQCTQSVHASVTSKNICATRKLAENQYLVLGEISERDARSNSNVSPFIGRTAELNILQECLSALHNGRGSVVLIEGSPGLGKTRLGKNVVSINLILMIGGNI